MYTRSDVTRLTRRKGVSSSYACFARFTSIVAQRLAAVRTTIPKDTPQSVSKELLARLHSIKTWYALQLRELAFACLADLNWANWIIAIYTTLAKCNCTVYWSLSSNVKDMARRNDWIPSCKGVQWMQHACEWSMRDPWSEQGVNQDMWVCIVSF